MNQTKDMLSQIESLSSRYLDYVSTVLPAYHNTATSEIKEKVIPLLNVDKPKVMVYGIYNSGKSTLINSLLREAKAEVAACPKTDAVTEYLHGNYVLMDAPGVDAPIAHEEVTNAHLSKCHVILFVMSSKGGFESVENYTRLLELIEKNIPFIIVLNERSVGMRADMSAKEKQALLDKYTQEINAAKEKIIQNLVKISGNKNIVNKYEVIALDAKKAWTAVEKDKPALYEKSNLNALELRLDTLLFQKETVQKLFMQPLLNLKNAMNIFEKNIAKKFNQDDHQDYLKMFELIELKKTNLFEELKTEIKTLTLQEESRISVAFKNGNHAELEKVSEEIYDSFNVFFTAKMNEYTGYIQLYFRDLTLNKAEGSGQNSFSTTNIIDHVDHTIRLDEGSSSYAPSSDQADAQLVGNIAGALVLAPVPTPVKVTAVIVSTLAQLMGNDAKEREEERRIEAENRAYNRQQEQIEAEKLRIIQEVAVATETFMRQIEKNLMRTVTSHLTQSSSSILTQIQEIQTKNENISDQCKKEVAGLNRLQAELTVLESELL